MISKLFFLRKLTPINVVMVFLVTIFVPSLSSAAGEEMMFVSVKSLAKAPAEEIVIRNKRERVVARVKGSQIVQLYAVMTALREVAEVETDFYIVTGKQPNAFACPACPLENKEEQRRNRRKGPKPDEEDPNKVIPNIVAINFAMLELFESDMHEAAAIIGHELAHLKLKHGEENKKQREKQTSGGFSASGTRYSRDNERDADYLGVIWTIEAGFDPSAAARVHEKLYRLPKGGFGGSHPSSIERVTVLKSLARRLAR
jgi:Zn-dependent protease with chaperone function